MTTQQAIESKDVTLAELFNDFFIVPDYQREYVWSEDEEEQVEQLFNDIYGEFLNQERTGNSEYFIGSIVVCKPGDVYELIDGQQRMTTAYLFLCAVRDYLKEMQASPIDVVEQQIRGSSVDNDGNSVYRYRVELQYEDSRDILQRIASGEIIPDGTEGTRSIKNIVHAYWTIRKLFDLSFQRDERRLRKFYAFFTKNVKLIRIRTNSVAQALKIFETINDRGKGLDAMDLLKNLMFMHAKQAEFDKIKLRWKNLVDNLYKSNEKPLRFLRYFIIAHYDAERLREDEIYSWFLKNEDRCGYRENPVQFVDNLLLVAQQYSNFIKGKDISGESNRYLDNIRMLSGAARQHLILLLAGRNLEKPLFMDLCKHTENLLFAYIITRENTREFEQKFTQWAKEIRAIQTQDQLDAFFSARFEPAKKELSSRFVVAFVTMKLQDLQRYRMRYLLGKMTQYVDEAPERGGGDHSNLATYTHKSIHIEHILPDKPSAESLREFDKPDEFMLHNQRLGNLVLAEESLNTFLGNKPYSEKRPYYERSKFLLTRCITKIPKIGGNTAYDRVTIDLESFDTWTSDSIEKRQVDLARLALNVWQMQKPN